MKINLLAITALGMALSHASFAADKEEKSATAAEKAFIMKAAQGGMAEVAMGKVAAEKGGSEEVKDFGEKMVADHSKANENLKEVASKMGVEIPAEIGAEHKAMADKMSSMSGAAFDKAYVQEMVKDHQKDIAEFEEAKKMVKNEDLKEFIDNTLETMKGHLESIKKFDQAKQ